MTDLSKMEKTALIFHALSDVRRLRIVELLFSGEKCVCALTKEMDMPQSSLSYHMKILCEAGIVNGRVFGKWTYYSLRNEALTEAALYIKTIKRHVK